MRHRIRNKKTFEYVGHVETLEDGDLSITFHDVWVGLFSSFAAWNCQHGLIYIMEVDLTGYDWESRLFD